MQPCKCRAKVIQANRIKFADLPATFSDVKLKDFDFKIYQQDESKKRINIAAKCIKYYLDNFEEMKKAGKGLYLHSSEKGSGKTRMIVSIANELLERNYQVKFATSSNILNEIKATWSKEKLYSESNVLDFLITTDILIIDDFGTEKAANWINERFYHIINERYIHKKVTLYTSNKTLQCQEYDDRITNRILETTYQLSFPEESVRKIIATQNNKELIKRVRGE